MTGMGIEKTEIKKHKPIVYRVYDYIKENHLGKANGIHKKDLAEELNIDVRLLRYITQEINESGDFEHIISVSQKCYMCNTEDECEEAMITTFKTAFTILKKARKMEKKLSLNNQYKMKLGEYYKEYVETFKEVEDA